MITYVLLDIEGTTTPITFVHDVLFPFSKRHLKRYVADPERAARLLRYIEEDRKDPELKELQGRIWQEGYASGELVSVLYPDVKPALEKWKAAGKSLGIYSSGSVQAQKLLFAHTQVGDLTPLFSDYFDTKVGAKRQRSAYERIVKSLGRPAGEILFLSDVTEELDAAAAAHMKTTQLVRPGTAAGTHHPVVASFDEL